MLTRSRIMLAALTAALALAVATGSAVARRFELSEQRFLAEFGSLTYQGGGWSSICALTLEGSFHSRTISKVSGQLSGYLTEVMISQPCTEMSSALLNGTERLPGGEVTSNTLPWHIRYISFTGALPRIASFKLAVIGYAFLMEILGNSCLYRSTERQPEFYIAELNAEGRIAGLRVEETTRIPKNSGSLICPNEAIYAGRARVGRQPEEREREWREIIVRLVS